MNFELTEEQKMLRDMARQFAEQEMLPKIRENERQRKKDYEITKKMAALGLKGIQVPQEYGGLDLIMLPQRLSGSS